MDQPQARKRRREETGPPDSPTRNSRPDARPTKIQRRRYPDLECCGQEAPKFRHSLLKFSLVAQALKEHNSRTRWRPNYPRPITIAAQDVTVTSEILEQAQNGGPDLTSLRGYVAPDRKMALPPERSERSTHSIAAAFFHPGFQRRLSDNGVYMCTERPNPNWHEVQQILSGPVLEIPPELFEHFLVLDNKSKERDDIIQHVIPFVLDTQIDDLPIRNAVLNNLLSLLFDEPTVDAQPDLYYGSDPDILEPVIRTSLSGYIVPAIMDDKPVVPNFFVEVRSAAGNFSEAALQACYNGALGARGMHYLQNSNVDQPIYDGRPLSFSAVYHLGVLRVYAHHITAPRALNEGPKYHMTRLGQYVLTESPEDFRKGVTVFRAIRDLAKRYRDSFIHDANQRLYRRPLPEV